MDLLIGMRAGRVPPAQAALEGAALVTELPAGRGEQLLLSISTCEATYGEPCPGLAPPAPEKS